LAGDLFLVLVTSFVNPVFFPVLQVYRGLKTQKNGGPKTSATGKENTLRNVNTHNHTLTR